MDMDTSEITISRIVGFPWNEPGTDVEDELPTPASSPAQCTTTAVMPVEPGDPQELEDNLDLDLANVLLDVSVMPTMISPIEDSLVSPTTAVSEYAAPDIPTVELVTESPGYAVPEDSELVTSWVPRYSPASMASTVGGGGHPTDVDRAAVTLCASGDGRALHRNVRPITPKYAVAIGGFVAVSRTRRDVWRTGD